MNILTSYINPPIPVRDHDWMAHIEGEEEGPTGYGQTEEDALRALCEELALLWLEADDGYRVRKYFAKKEAA